MNHFKLGAAAVSRNIVENWDAPARDLVFDVKPGRTWAPYSRHGLRPVPGIDTWDEWAPWEQADASQVQLPDEREEKKPNQADASQVVNEESESAPAQAENSHVEVEEAPASDVVVEIASADTVDSVPVERVKAQTPSVPLKTHQRKRPGSKVADQNFRAPRLLFVDVSDDEDEKGSHKNFMSVPWRGETSDSVRNKRLGRSVYDALQTHGHFGLVDGGETMAGGIRRIVVHVPKRNRGYMLDIKVGDVIYANSAKGRAVRGRLDVLYVSRHKYIPPGHAVTSCVIGVSDTQWERFMD